MQRGYPEKLINREMGNVVLSKKKRLRNKKGQMYSVCVNISSTIKTAGGNNSKSPLHVAYGCWN